MTMREKKYFFVFCGIFLVLSLVVAAGAWRAYSRLDGQAPAATIDATPESSSVENEELWGCS